jgi:branched-chain amino acid transport system ATP-binding protein
MTQPLLAVDRVSMRFGGIVALDGVSFSIDQGQICGFIGPNGSGKTTLFNCLSRLYTPQSGEIRFRGVALQTLSRHAIAGLGIGRTFQNLALFRTMTVFDNVMVGTHCRTSSGFAASAFRMPNVPREEDQARARAWELIDLLDLRDVAGTVIGDLPFGTQKRVELARALACAPQLLLLDEPAGGLNHEEVEALGSLIKLIRDRGVTILLVEHHMNLVMRISDKVVALNFGRVIADGLPQDVRSNADVIRSYLGKAA